MFGWKIVRRRRRVRRPAPQAQAYRTHREAARKIITERTEYFAARFGFSYKRIAIRNSRRSWGSCSALGNLNFHYKLMFLPTCLRDYIIVHELCHLRELNHGPGFWAQVEALMPDAKARAVELRHFERTCGTAVSTLERLADAHTNCVSCRSSVDL